MRGVGKRPTPRDGYAGPPSAGVRDPPGILHDWDDEHCVAILRSARNATVEGGRLLVIEEALALGPETSEDRASSRVDRWSARRMQ